MFDPVSLLAPDSKLQVYQHTHPTFMLVPYVVIPAPPTALSTLDIREIQSAHFYSKTGGWYAEKKEKFAHEDKTSPGWLMIKKTPVSKSTQKTWNEQNKPLSALEKVPNVSEISWFITTYFEVRGIRLFEKVFVRTSSLSSDDLRVYVGHYNSGGLCIRRWMSGGRAGGLGLSAARKN